MVVEQGQIHPNQLIFYSQNKVAIIRLCSNHAASLPFSALDHGEGAVLSLTNMKNKYILRLQRSMWDSNSLRYRNTPCEFLFLMLTIYNMRKKAVFPQISTQLEMWHWFYTTIQQTKMCILNHSLFCHKIVAVKQQNCCASPTQRSESESTIQWSVHKYSHFNTEWMNEWTRVAWVYITLFLPSYFYIELSF